LSHLQIVEIGSAAAASYARACLRTSVRPFRRSSRPGDPLRHTAPYTPNGHSAWFAFLNFNKSSVALDPNDESALLRLSELIGDCDILIDGRDIDAADCPAFDLARSSETIRALFMSKQAGLAVRVHTGILRRPTRHSGADGLVKLVGPVEGPPVHAPDFQTGILAGLWAL